MKKSIYSWAQKVKKSLNSKSLASNLTADDEALFVTRGSNTLIDRVGSLLPYGHEIEPGLFTIMDEKHQTVESVGFTLEMIPQTGATPEMAEQLTSLFSPVAHLTF